MRMLSNKMRDKLYRKRSFNLSLTLIFILAIFLRCLMPFYLLRTNKPYGDYMIASSYAHDMLAMAISTAKGEGLHLEYLSYIEHDFKISSPELNKIQRTPSERPFFLDKGGLAQIFIAGMLTFFMNSLNVPAIQIFQGIVDSLGCLLVFGILSFYFNRRTCLLGALIYAIWPASIFYSYHFMAEAYIPILMLAIGYTIIWALKTEKWHWFATAGLLIGLSFSFRFDNFLILITYMLYILWVYRKKMFIAFVRAMLVFGFCVLSLIPFKIIIPKNSQNVPIIGVALYNSLGEYPGTFKGLRFFDDQTAPKHGIEKGEEYLKNNDRAFKFMHRVFNNDSYRTSHHLIILAYIREVIIDKPFLYIDWLIRRFFVYLPANPFIACIAYFFKNPHGTASMVGYRYSQVFQIAKYLDYLLFLFFMYGVWSCRKNKEILSLLCIYFGVLVSHVIVGGGEVYFRNDMEYAYIDPRYLLGMVSIWPVFISIFISKKLIGVDLSKDQKNNIS